MADGTTTVLSLRRRQTNWWRREAETTGVILLSIVIPTLNAVRTLPATLNSIAASGGVVCEVIVVDGGSIDGTREVAGAAGAVVIDAPRGRGSQLAAGGARATGAWLLFLHADSRLPFGWTDAVMPFMAGSDNYGRAAYFRFALDDPKRVARRLERVVLWRNRVFGLPYGDQGLLIRRAFYEGIGGFRQLPLMEDVDLVCRIGRSRLTMLPARLVTSAERYRRGGYLRRSLRNLMCLGLYALGVPPRFIAPLYR